MGEKCWNCGSMNYLNGIATESCPDCGIGCDYWGGGANDEYLAAMARREEEAKREEERRWPHDKNY